MFLPFINPEVFAEPLATVPLIKSEGNEKIEVESPSSLDNVAERSSETFCEQDQVTTFPLSQSVDEKENTKIKRINISKVDHKVEDVHVEVKEEVPDVDLKVVPGYVTECTLLQSVAIKNLKIHLKGVKNNSEVINIPESVRIKGTCLESAVYKSSNGKLELLITSTLNKDVSLRKGTQIGEFQICQCPIMVISEQTDESEASKVSVCSMQEDVDLVRKFRTHFTSTSRPDLEPDLLSLLVKIAMRLPYQGTPWARQTC